MTNGVINGAAVEAPPDEMFVFRSPGQDGTPLRIASDEELVGLEAQLTQQLAQANSAIAQAQQQATLFGQLVAVIKFERERRTKSLVIAHRLPS